MHSYVRAGGRGVCCLTEFTVVLRTQATILLYFMYTVPKWIAFVPGKRGPELEVLPRGPVQLPAPRLKPLPLQLPAIYRWLPLVAVGCPIALLQYNCCCAGMRGVAALRLHLRQSSGGGE